MKKILLSLFLIFSIIILVSCDNTPLIPGGGGNNTNNLREKNPKYDIYYEIFVRSFADSDGDGIGDFNGVTENLDYLSDLGVTAIWLMPINETDTDWDSYHGYRIKDYYNVNPEYGTMEDLENLIIEANKLDINVVMDLVINHTSDTHPWYVEARNDQSSKYRDYYMWTAGNNAYESFDGGMKDLNLDSPVVVDEVKNIISFWLNKGMSGFRFDAAKHFFQRNKDFKTAQEIAKTYVFLRELKAHAITINPNTFFVGEVFDYYYQSYKEYYYGLDSLFDFYAAGEIWDKIGAGNSKRLLVSNLIKSYDFYKLSNPDFIPSNFIGNHDLNRIASNGNFTGDNGLLKLKLAAAFLLTIPGSPHIYYGDELGMTGTDYNGNDFNGQGAIYDQYRRSPFIWGDNNKDTTWLMPHGGSNDAPSVKTQLNDPNSLLNYYKEFANIRKNNPALMYGNTMSAWNGNTTNLQGFIRTYDDSKTKQSVLVIHNLSSSRQVVNLNYKNLIYGDLEIPKFGTLIVEIDSKLINDYI